MDNGVKNLCSNRAHSVWALNSIEIVHVLCCPGQSCQRTQMLAQRTLNLNSETKISEHRSVDFNVICRWVRAMSKREPINRKFKQITSQWILVSFDLSFFIYIFSSEFPILINGMPIKVLLNVNHSIGFCKSIWPIDIEAWICCFVHKKLFSRQFRMYANIIIG